MELNLGPPNTNPSSGKDDDLNLGPPDQTCSTLKHKAKLPSKKSEVKRTKEKRSEREGDHVTPAGAREWQSWRREGLQGQVARAS